MRILVTCPHWMSYTGGEGIPCHGKFYLPMDVFLPSVRFFVNETWL